MDMRNVPRRTTTAATVVWLLLLLLLLGCVPTLVNSRSRSPLMRIPGINPSRLFHSVSLRKHCTTTTTRKNHATPTTPTTKNANSLGCGTQIRCRQPTAERVSSWFRTADGPRRSGDTDWNFDSVGMTNPCLHVSVSPQQGRSYRQQQLVVQEVASSNATGWTTWWPNAVQPVADNNDDDRDSKWRVSRVCRVVGQGRACYEAVRDAALQWDFHDNDHDDNVLAKRGMLTVPSARHMGDRLARPHPRERHDVTGTGLERVHTASYGDGDLYTPAGDRVLTVFSDGGRRRMVTYSEVALFGTTSRKHPRLFVVNPVQVVYNVLDQRGPATTYTSTAYATLKGHWLRGEERVTVAHRDGSGNVDVEIVSYSRPSTSVWGRLIWPLVGPMQQQFFHSQMDALERVGRSESTLLTPSPHDTMVIDASTVLSKHDIAEGWGDR